MTDGTGGQTYAYDDDDALTTKNVIWTGFSAKTMSYGFYPDGSRSSMTADGRSFSYGYDGAGRMTRLTNPHGEMAWYSYQANGWLADQVSLNATGDKEVDAITTRNALGQVTDLMNQDVNGDVLSEYGSLSGPGKMAYDGVGNRLSVTASVPGAPASYSGTTSYGYDYGQSANPQMNRSQLTAETSTRATGTLAYAYDGGTSGGPGNPTSFQGQTRTFNANNQVTSTGYTYDGNGNPTIYQSAPMTFDPENRMRTDGSSQTNAYSGDGLRAWEQEDGGARTYFLYDGTEPVVEESSTGALAAINTFGTDGLVSRYTATASTFYAFDERGNVGCACMPATLPRGRRHMERRVSSSYRTRSTSCTMLTATAPEPTTRTTRGDMKRRWGTIQTWTPASSSAPTAFTTQAPGAG